MKLTKSKIMALVVALALLAVAAIKLPTITSASSMENVQLIYSQAATKNGHIYAYGYVQTKTANQKDSVVLHYQVGNGEWADVNAKYIGKKDDTYGLWYFIIDGGEDPLNHYIKAGKDFKFAIKYTTSSGKEYWDNNGGNDYCITGGYYGSYSRHLLGANNVTLSSAELSTAMGFSGQIAVKNLAYAKDIKVRYSFDNWATIKETSAKYGYTEKNGVEIWSFQESIPTNAKNVKFAISYTVNGKTYWDNNFKEDYSLSLSDYLSFPGLR